MPAQLVNRAGLLSLAANRQPPAADSRADPIAFSAEPKARRRCQPGHASTPTAQIHRRRSETPGSAPARGELPPTTHMPGLVEYSAAGLGLLALAALESLPLRLPPLPLRLLPTTTPQHAHRHLLAALLSTLCLLAALLSAHHLSLPTLAASALFLLYSVTPFTPLPAPPPPQLLDLLLAAAFSQELLLFAHRRPSTAAGIENQYFDLLLVPITVCLGATLLAAHSPHAPAPRLARAAGLALQGTWMVQMGFSFFTSAIASGCALHAAETRVDYTIKCRTHEDYHRARSVATLQFNGHLALLVIAGAATYAAVVSKGGGQASGYRMLGKEVQMEGMPSQFTLDSDEEKETAEIKAAVIAAPVSNGAHSHHQIELHVPDSK